MRKKYIIVILFKINFIFERWSKTVNALKEEFYFANYYCTVMMVFNAYPGSHSKTIYSSKLSCNKIKMKAKKNLYKSKTIFNSSKPNILHSLKDRNFWLSADCSLRISEPLSFVPLNKYRILVLSLIMALSASRWAVNRHMGNKFYPSSFTFCSYIY